MSTTTQELIETHGGEAVVSAGDALKLAADMVELDCRLDEAKAFVDRLKEERATLEEKLLEQYAETGTQSVRVSGRAVGIRRDLYAKVLDAERLHAALAAAGFGDLIQPKVDSSRLSALVREIDRGDVPQPDAFEGVVGKSEKFSIRVTAR